MPAHVVPLTRVTSYLCVLLVLAGAGCTFDPAPVAQLHASARELVASTPTARAVGSNVTPKRVTNRKSYRKGKVVVLEYHRFGPKESRWRRSYKNFAYDLNRLYRDGYRPVTMEQYVTNKMDLPPGASPVVITMDDGHPSQFLLKSDGSVDPNSGLGIWHRFAQTHPDFPVRASLYVIPRNIWGQGKWVDRKFELLKEWGCEVGSHTISHRRLDKLTDAEITKELAKSVDWIRSKGFEPRTVVPPYGILPKHPDLFRKFEYKGKKYGFVGLGRIGAVPAPSPISSKFNPYRVPRIQPTGGDVGLTAWLNRARVGKVRTYVR